MASLVAMMWRARLSARSPPWLSRCRTVRPLLAGTGLAPASAANAASLRHRPGWEKLTIAWAALTGPMPGRSFTEPTSTPDPTADRFTATGERQPLLPIETVRPPRCRLSRIGVGSRDHRAGRRSPRPAPARGRRHHRPHPALLERPGVPARVPPPLCASPSATTVGVRLMVHRPDFQAGESGGWCSPVVLVDTAV
jgi:hypothetical protein